MEWTNKTNRAKNGSGLDPEKKPHFSKFSIQFLQKRINH